MRGLANNHFILWNTRFIKYDTYLQCVIMPASFFTNERHMGRKNI